MNVPPKGTLERATAEFTVALIRAFRLRLLARWMSRQPWVAAYAEWDERHVPKWFTPWNVAYAGVCAYGIVIVVGLLTR